MVVLVNYAIYVDAGRPPLVFRLDMHEGEATPVEVEDAPALVARYARSLEAWAGKRPIPEGGLAAEFFVGMREVCPTGMTVTVEEPEPIRLQQAAA